MRVYSLKALHCYSNIVDGCIGRVHCWPTRSSGAANVLKWPPTSSCSANVLPHLELGVSNWNVAARRRRIISLDSASHWFRHPRYKFHSKFIAHVGIHRFRRRKQLRNLSAHNIVTNVRCGKLCPYGAMLLRDGYPTPLSVNACEVVSGNPFCEHALIRRFWPLPGVRVHHLLAGKACSRARRALLAFHCAASLPCKADEFGHKAPISRIQMSAIQGMGFTCIC